MSVPPETSAPGGTPVSTPPPPAPVSWTARPRRPRRLPSWLAGFAAGVVVTAAVAVGIAAASPAPSGTAPDSAPAAAASTPPPATTSASAAIGEQVTNGGITVTVTSAAEVPTIALNESGYQPGSGYETYTEQEPGAGARFFAVTVHVVNDAPVSIDLTCGYPIGTALVDDRGREFDPVDTLYQLRGNPECNDNLQPGFESDMTYVYRVPDTAVVTGWAFVDATDPGSYGRASTLVAVP